VSSPISEVKLKRRLTQPSEKLKQSISGVTIEEFSSYNQNLQRNKRSRIDAVDDHSGDSPAEEQYEATCFVSNMLSEETFCTDRLNEWLQTELLSGEVRSRAVSGGRVKVGSGVSHFDEVMRVTMTQDPLKFIEMCKSEREQLDKFNDKHFR